LYRCNQGSADTSNVLDQKPIGAERRLKTPLIVLMALLAFPFSACSPARRQSMAHLPVSVELAAPCPGEGGMPRFIDQEAVLMTSQLRATGTQCRK